jgi:hypothetical protein
VRTGAAEDSGDLDELDWDPIRRNIVSTPFLLPGSRVASHLAESILACVLRSLGVLSVVDSVVVD